MSVDTSLSDLIFRSAEHPAALPDFIIYFFQSAGRSHTADIAETSAESRGWSGVQKAHAPRLLAGMTNKSCLSVSFFPPPPLKILKQNLMYKDMVN